MSADDIKETVLDALVEAQEQHVQPLFFIIHPETWGIVTADRHPYTVNVSAGIQLKVLMLFGLPVILSTVVAPNEIHLEVKKYD